MKPRSWGACMRLRVEPSSTRANRPVTPTQGVPIAAGLRLPPNTLRDEISACGRAVPIDRQYDFDHSHESSVNGDAT